MYYITEKHNAIKTIQRFLGESESGVYDKRTKDKITKHQVENNLGASGIVDYETFNSLKANYLKAGENCIIFSNFPYKKGDFGFEIGILNALITEVIGEYAFEGATPLGNYYSEDTVEAVVRLREIFMLEYSEDVDMELLFRLTAEKNAINLSKSNG